MPELSEPQADADAFVEIDTSAPPVAEPEVTEAEPEAEPEAGKEGEEETPLRDESGRFKGKDGRIDELTRHRRDEERARRAAEAERDYYKGLATQKGALPDAEVSKPKPTPDQFDTDEAFFDALTDWKLDQRETSRAKADMEAREAATTAQRNEDWSAKVADVAEALPDYGEVVGKSDVPIAAHVGEALMDADRGPELAYHLAQNPDVAAKLNSMSAARAAMELGRIEASLGSGSAKPAARQSNAPPPIQPVRPGATTTKDPAKMDQADYNEWRAKQLRR